MQSIITVRRPAALGIAAAAALGLPLAACGDDDAGAGRTTTGTVTVPTVARGAARPNGVDRAFAQGMVPHHEGAIAMAEIARDRGSSAFVRDLAGAILRTQAAEVRRLKAADARLARAGVATGDLGLSDAEMGMGHDMAMLERADDVDRAFVEMMIPHHEGAIAMAQVELDRGGDAALRRLAQQIVAAQQGEIDAMRRELGDAGGGAHEGH